MLERNLEAHLVKRVAELGGDARKIQWVSRRGAPDRLVMLPGGRVLWLELKNPEAIKTFPANAHERQQQREIERMRGYGLQVEVVGTIERIEELLK